MINPAENIINLFYPKICLSCDKSMIKSENLICISCRNDFPLTHFTEWKGNTIETSFYGRIPIESATSLLFYNKKGIVQKLIYQLKYKNQQQIGNLIGNWLGQEMLLSKRFNSIDYIIPVPLHSKKYRQRGYNQVTTFGKSLSKNMNVPYLENILIRISTSKTQTKKNRFERSKNMEEKFDLPNKEILKGKHVLLIDDIITTGATIEACCVQLIQSENIKISIATMAYTL